MYVVPMPPVGGEDGVEDAASWVSCAAGAVLPGDVAALGVIRGPLDAAAAITIMNRAPTDRRPVRTLWRPNQERRGRWPCGGPPYCGPG